MMNVLVSWFYTFIIISVCFNFNLILVLLTFFGAEKLKILQSPTLVGGGGFW